MKILTETRTQFFRFSSLPGESLFFLGFPAYPENHFFSRISSLPGESFFFSDFQLTRRITFFSRISSLPGEALFLPKSPGKYVSSQLTRRIQFFLHEIPNSSRAPDLLSILPLTWRIWFPQILILSKNPILPNISSTTQHWDQTTQVPPLWALSIFHCH